MKSNEPNIKINWAFHLFNNFVGYVTPLIVTPYVSRIFESDGMGINSYTTATVTYFTMFCMLGVAGYGQRTIAICQDDKEKVSQVFWELFVLHMFTSLAVLVSYVILILSSDKYRIYYIVNLITIFGAVIDFNWFFEAYERFKFISIRNCVLRVASLLAIFAFVRTKEDLAIYIGINALSGFLGKCSVVIGLRRYIKRVPISSLNCKRHIKEILIYFVPTIAASVYSILDKSVINWITGSDAENGYYDQAYKIMLLVNTMIHSLEAVMAPRMSNIYANGTQQELRKRLNDSLHIMIYTAMPCVFGISAITTTFVPVFFGEGYAPVIPIMYVFMILVVVVSFSVYLDGLYIVPSGQRGKSAAANCVGATVNLFLNIFLVIKLQAFGAAIATLVTEMVIASILFYVSWDYVDKERVVAAVVRYGITGMLMFVGVKFIAHSWEENVGSLILQIGIGAALYLLMLLIQRDRFTLDMARRVTGMLKSNRQGIK